MNSEVKPFGTVLVANRGEIAVRIIRSVKALGLRSVAVYSDADKNAPHVQSADTAVAIGPAPIGDSYLNVDRILAAARSSGSEAIHPGYGFLSENAEFARTCEQSGFVFIGPGAAAIELMGDKAKSKRHLASTGVPCVPGYQGEDQATATLLLAAEEIGFPVMVKAAAGGGGRGMRLVQDQSQLEAALKVARSEAENAFGNGDLILEKAIAGARHVEVQVFGDYHGNMIHLGERDCSVQRRHQKIIEEAPCPVMTSELRERMGAAAVQAARSVEYVGAGTVEFLLDVDSSFYFLEMNTRLQVEHPVTELVTGLDLVEMQLRVAAGEPLEIAQDELELRGHAIEVRLYAEDPANNFLPVTGKIELWCPPEGEYVRTDSGICSGLEVTPYYDPMLAKIMAWGETRDIARRRLTAALERTALFGPPSNRDFLISTLQTPTFTDGAATTTFVEEAFGTGQPGFDSPTNIHYAAASVLQFEVAMHSAQANAFGVPKQLLKWTNAASVISSYDYSSTEQQVLVSLTPDADRDYQVDVNGEVVTVRTELFNAPFARLTIDNTTHDVIFQVDRGREIYLCLKGLSLHLVDATAQAPTTDQGDGDGCVTAAMHGLLVDLVVAAGDTVERGDTVAVIEAMKMQHEIRAGIDGTVLRVEACANSQIAAGELLLEIVPTQAATS